MNPSFWLPPFVPFTCQVTAVLALPITVAMNCLVVKFATVAVCGCTLTCTAEAVAVTVTIAESDFVESACDVAVTVTVAGFGTEAGAV